MHQVSGHETRVIANPGSGNGMVADLGANFAPPHVVPVDLSLCGNGSLDANSSKTLTVTEAPPVTELVTELVTESPLENGLAASNIGVIGGNKIHFLLLDSQGSSDIRRAYTLSP